jgi:hypothetical protein
VPPAQRPAAVLRPLRRPAGREVLLLLQPAAPEEGPLQRLAPEEGPLQPRVAGVVHRAGNVPAETSPEEGRLLAVRLRPEPGAKLDPAAQR